MDINWTTTRASLCLLWSSLSVKVNVTQSCPTLCDSMDYGQNTGVGSSSLLQGIFPTQGSNSGLPHCRRILYQMSHKGSPRILEWVAHPIASGSSWPRNRTRVSCIAGGFFINWAMREAHTWLKSQAKVDIGNGTPIFFFRHPPSPTPLFITVLLKQDHTLYNWPI